MNITVTIIVRDDDGTLKNKYGAVYSNGINADSIAKQVKWTLDQIRGEAHDEEAQVLTVEY